MDFVGYIIGGGQLGLLLGIFYRMGVFSRALRDHEANDEARFSRLERIFNVRNLPRDLRAAPPARP